MTINAQIVIKLYEVYFYDTSNKSNAQYNRSGSSMSISSCYSMLRVTQPFYTFKIRLSLGGLSDVTHGVNIHHIIQMNKSDCLYERDQGHPKL